MTADIRTHPAVQEKVKKDVCPKCGGELDTGWECNDCDFDAMPFLHAQTKLPQPRT